MESSNRKLIRPSLAEAKEQLVGRRNNPAAQNNSNSGSNKKKAPPPEHTNAENFYYLKQMQTRTPMVIVLRDGEAVHGTIEWYDKSCLKLARTNEPNLLIYKPNIKYMYKAAG